MTIQQAIEKAESSGYVAEWRKWKGTINEAFLDPLFWQSLGKAMGWEEKDKEMKKTFLLVGGKNEEDMAAVWREWFHQWHRFIDHLAEGKDAESFFKELWPSNSKK